MTKSGAAVKDPTQAPPDRYCDVVMKGGITSGIVYPQAIDELARRYHFKNIGGTSAGAIAAVATAAAEYRRRHSGSMEGFDRLAKLPDELGAHVAGTKQSRLLALFQPQTSTRRLFGVLVASLNRDTTFGRVAAVVMGFIGAYWPAVLAATVLSILVWRSSGLVAAVLFWLIAVLLGIGYWTYLDVTRNVVDNDYGLCTGMSASHRGPHALVPWLHELIQDISGKGAHGDPLTFGDLWKAPGFPPPWFVPPASAGPVKSIALEMFTTNLSHGRPYLVPFEDPTTQLYFRKEEIRKYLPAGVVHWIDTHHGGAYAPDPERLDRDPSAAEGKGLFALPPPEDFPVVFAARMSLSFPFLFSAIPLWAIDHETDPKKQKREFKRCLFSDGGICSNFPMHLFDGLIPMWPTFGILLEPKLPARTNMVYLPQSYKEGYGERWDRFDEKKRESRFGGFLSAVASAMQNWNDNALSRMPGVRDRVVRIRLNEQEGGMNLNMDKDLIVDVAARGRDAARELVKRYVAGTDGAAVPGWEEQRWVRLNVFLRMLEKRLPVVERGLQPGVGFAPDFPSIFEQAAQSPPAGRSHALTASERATLEELVSLLTGFSAEVGRLSRSYSFEPVPEPELRVRPPL